MKKYIAAVLALASFAFGLSIILLHKGAGHSDASADAFCEEHQIAEADCPFCDKSLIKKKGFCAEHGVPEALCYRCNPALIAAFKSIGDWCAEHESPESQCVICKLGGPGEAPAEIPVSDPLEKSSPVQLVPAAESLRSKRPPSVECENEKLRVQFDSAEIARNAGLQYASLQRIQLSQTIECNMEIKYNSNKYVNLSARAPGVIQEVRKDLGRQVAAGDVLAVVNCPDAGKAKADYLEAAAFLTAAQGNYEREQRLLELHVSTEPELLEAEKELSRSKIFLSNALQNLRNLGLSDEQIENVGKKHDTSSFLGVKAPFAGTVVQRNAVAGETVDASRPIFEIADTSRLWAMLEVKETDSKLIRSGLSVIVSVDSLPGETFGGQITWVSSHIDPKTRMLQARAEIANNEGLLRPNMFGKATVTVFDKQPAVVVPREAVQWDGCCNMVFVKQSDTLFEPRKVRLGYETEKVYAVDDGLNADEVVVTSGSFLLKTEILKGSIGAGCCEFGAEN